MKSAPVPVERVAYTPDEAAEALGVCRSHVYKLLNDGVLRSVNLGRSRRIPVESINELLRGGDAA